MALSDNMAKVPTTRDEMLNSFLEEQEQLMIDSDLLDIEYEELDQDIYITMAKFSERRKELLAKEKELLERTRQNNMFGRQINELYPNSIVFEGEEIKLDEDDDLEEDGVV